MGDSSFLSNMSNMNVFGQGLTLMGGLYTADQQRKQGAAEQAYYNMEAKLKEREAEQFVLQGQTDQLSLARSTRQLMASQRAAMAANGIALDSGTAQDIAWDTIYQSALDQAAIKYNAENAAWASNYEAGLKRVAGAQANAAGRANAAATLIGTATAMAKQWMMMSDTSAGSPEPRKQGQSGTAADGTVGKGTVYGWETQRDPPGTPGNGGRMRKTNNVPYYGGGRYK